MTLRMGEFGMGRIPLFSREVAKFSERKF